MGKNKSIFQKILRRWLDKYRFKIINESTFEEVASFRLSRMNIFIVGGIGSFILIGITTAVIAYTPLREYIPGYADVEIRKQALVLSKRTDSLEMAMQDKDVYLYNIKAIIDGKPLVRSVKEMRDSSINYRNIQDTKSREDSLLRKELYEEKNYRIGRSISSEKLLYFNPIRGQVVDSANIPAGKFAIGIKAVNDEPVKSIADGIVLAGGWSPETSYYIIILHPNTLISVYKNVSSIFHKSGDFVRAGEAIAQLKQESNGDKILYFEIWNRNSPVNPTHIIAF